MYIKQDYEIGELYKHLWSGARDRWVDATEEQRKQVWDRLTDYWYDDDESNPPTMTEINDTIWFECDDIFFPEEDEEE